ncbi:MAG: component of SufBCD complex [Limimaricola sp.]|uniref:component of SufBCD complex n=1 Tax=Limimaricola sp. TaxID=2211665 RepID=UPI001E122129|nr:component of SufBCD complex [Limimaricola sp.]MBI1418047.1 component of SufBCD complex [Limimaricola sp.]
MHWTKTIFEVIDMRSFSNLWFWIALAVLWSSTSHWVLGVPFDLVQRGARQGGQAQQDLEDMVRINVNRLLYIGRVSGLWVLGVVCFVLSALAGLGFWYQIEIAQAIFLLVFPLSLVGGLSLATARLIEAEGLQGDALHRRLVRHRIYVQIIGMISIFITAMWGMYQNLAAMPGFG